MVAFYNDIDQYCCRWLEHLIAADELPYGIVSEKPIIAVNYSDLSMFSQCHFFAGIGGWPLALRMAGWPINEQVWTGSCPCQPFSQASQSREKSADVRHLWPDFFQLIAKYRPSTVFGEQVAGSDGLQWFSDARADLESLNYAVGAANLPASSIGAEHKRNRIFWVAHTSKSRLERFKQQREELQQFSQKTPTLSDYSGLRSRFQIKPDPKIIPTFDGVSRPVDIVRAFGNAIVPQVAAIFIKAFMEVVL